MKELNALNDIYQGMYESKKADKDYDGDGKIESGTAEYLLSKDKAIKKAMKNKAYVTEISANKLIDAAKAAEVKRGKAASAGDRETAKKALSQNKKFYDAAKAKRKNEEVEISPEVEKLIESGLFSDSEIAKIADIQEADIADIIARLEKKRISKGGDPKESPLPAMRKYHADKKKKAKK